MEVRRRELKVEVNAVISYQMRTINGISSDTMDKISEFGCWIVILRCASHNTRLIFSAILDIGKCLLATFAVAASLYIGHLFFFAVLDISPVFSCLIVGSLLFGIVALYDLTE